MKFARPSCGQLNPSTVSGILHHQLNLIAVGRLELLALMILGFVICILQAVNYCGVFVFFEPAHGS
jgi:hypothetical protein